MLQGDAHTTGGQAAGGIEDVDGDGAHCSNINRNDAIGATNAQC
jgi:hypothetical protein